MKTVAIHQPNFMPWLQFFDKMKKCDQFVFLDDVQYEKNGWQNRHKIRTSDDSLWITIPVKSHLNLKLNQTKIDYTHNWFEKHRKSFLMNYSKAKYFDNNWKSIEKIFDMNYENIIHLNLDVIEFIKKKFNIKTKTILSSELDITSNGSKRIIDICKKLDADIYLSGRGLPGKKYIDENDFEINNVQLQYQNFIHPEYEQCYPLFVPNLTSLDLLFNQGKFL
tara:strand:+ start:1798 stop:2463 length:666 start_codon:yes stop_codon:yes gene_type:complete